MNDSAIAREVRDLWKAEIRVLPVTTMLAVAVCGVVWMWRLDQGGSGAFLMGVLVGALLTCALASFTFVVRLGRAIRGGPKGGLFVDAIRLARGK